MRVVLAALLAASLLFAPPAAARVWEVRADGSGDAPTIQAALDAASAGDLVRVGCGVYPDCSTPTPFGNACLQLKSGVDLEAEGDGCVVVDAGGVGLLVFAAGEFEDDIVGNSTWEEGDWNGDGDFSTGDLVAAFQIGHYSAEKDYLAALFV